VPQEHRANGSREEVLNVLLAQSLNSRGLVSIPESIKSFSSGKRRMPDVIVEYSGIRLYIEGRYFETLEDERSLIIDSKKRIDEGLTPVCIAILYPSELRSTPWDQLKSNLETSKLRIKVLTATKEEEWTESNIHGLSSILRRAYDILVEDDVVIISVDRLKDAIEKASDLFIRSTSVSDRFRMILGVFGESEAKDPKEDNLRVCRIASLTFANALIFQEVLASNFPSVKTIRKSLTEVDIVGAFFKVWDHILNEIDYVPIFNVGKELILELSNNAENIEAFKSLSEVALFIVSQKTALKHDLMGRIYHKLLVDAKYFGAFYTKISASTLLVELTFNPKYWETNFKNLQSINELKIADLACGTGTLLKSSLEAIVDKYIKSIIEDGDQLELSSLHKILLEEVIYGYDVLPFAVHLAASTLALHEPDIPFARMNLFVLPLTSYDHHFTLPRLGSLDFLSDRPIPLRTDLFGAQTQSPSQVTGSGDEKKTVKIPNLDLCVMNPPFTRSVGGNLLFGNFPKTERSVMQKRLQEIIKTSHIQANITAGLGSAFIALADKYIKKNGHLALVLPKAVLSGISWEDSRKLLLKRYKIRYVIVSHEPFNWNFSENTDLSECLIVADRNGNTALPDYCRVVNLWNQPKSSIESLALASKIEHSDSQKIDSSGICDLTLNGKKYGEIIDFPLDKNLEKFLMTSPNFAQTELVRVAFYLNNSILYLPGKGRIKSLNFVKLNSLFIIGPDRRDVHDGFSLSSSITPYPSIWGHDSQAITSLQQSPNQYLAPLTKAKVDRSLRDSNLLWSRSGRLLVAEKLWVKTDRLFAIWCPENVLSNVWWTLATLPSKSKIKQVEIEQVIALWLNSSLGATLFLSISLHERGAWMQFKKPTLEKLLVIDPFSLTISQKNELIDLYSRVSSLDLQPWSKAKDDKVRILIDTEFSRILNLPNISIIREMLSREPTITLETI
jgi:hypothetical protein